MDSDEGEKWACTIVLIRNNLDGIQADTSPCSQTWHENKLHEAEKHSSCTSMTLNQQELKGLVEEETTHEGTSMIALLLCR